MLNGERHSDDMFGGLGNDVFVFDSQALSGDVDRIGDFKKGNDFIQFFDGISVTEIVNNVDVAKVDGSSIVASSGGVTDTVLKLGNGAQIVIVDCNFQLTDGILLA